MNPLPFIAAGLVGLFVLSKKSAGAASNAAPGAPQPLRAGVPYLFILRLDRDVSDADVRAVLEPKGVENLLVSPAVLPPFWAQAGEAFDVRVASFKAVPRGNSTLTLGDPLYGLGRLETLVRLDGMPFAAEAPSA